MARDRLDLDLEAAEADLLEQQLPVDPLPVGDDRPSAASEEPIREPDDIDRWEQRQSLPPAIEDDHPGPKTGG